MSINEETARQGRVPPAAYIAGAAVLALLAISHAIGAIELLKDREWVWMAISLALMGLYASVAECLYNASKKATGTR